MMAEMVADDKKEENTDSESDVDDTVADDTGGGGFSPEPQDGSNTFGDDMLQMALKMATELDEPAVDLEGALTANTITASQTQEEVHSEVTEDVSSEQMHLIDRGQRGRKRRKIIFPQLDHKTQQEIINIHNRFCFSLTW